MNEENSLDETVGQEEELSETRVRGTDEEEPISSAKKAWKNAETWLLLTGDRRTVTLTLAIGVYLLLLTLSFVWPVELGTLLSETEAVQRLFNTLLSGVILLVSIVVSINSIVVSEEIDPIGDQHDEVVKAWEFRNHTSEEVDRDVSAADPNMFLGQILKAVDQELRSLATYLKPAPEESEELLQTFYDEMRRYIRSTTRMLSHSTSGTVDTRLFSAGYDPSEILATGRQIRERGSLSEEAETVLDDIIRAFHFFTAAREYFRTVYYKREFARLSRDILYGGLPAILLMSYVLLALDTQTFPGSTFGVDHLLLFMNLAYVIALTPFLILMSYVLRSAVIAEHIITAGAFTISSDW